MMRVKIKGKEDRPELYEVECVRSVWDNGMFTIECTLTENARKLTGCNFILASALTYDSRLDDSSAIEKDVLSKFETIMTSLALNGYANLVIGESTCELNEDWGVQLAI